MKNQVSPLRRHLAGCEPERDSVENLGDAIAEALGRDAAKLGTVAVNRIADETGRRPLFALAVAVGVGILIGMAARNSRSDLSN